MTYLISKDFAFSASHRLDGLPAEHQCSRNHGHNYLVRVELASPQLDDRGFVVDYGDLKPFSEWIDTTFDHQWLGTGSAGLASPAVAFNPTAENLAAHFRDWIDQFLPAVTQPGADSPRPISIAVGVSETPKTWAWCR